MRFAFGKNSLLIFSRESNVAMTMPMDVHEHGSSHKKGIFVNAFVLPLGHTLETQNSLLQFLLKFSS
jgi:hypothetical protein